MVAVTKGVKDAIQSILDRYGEVRPSVLVEEARNEKNPAHNAFEWDDEKAGHEFRLMQARQLIRKVEVVYAEQPARLVHVPTVEWQGEGSYKHPVIIVDRPDEFARALAEAQVKLEAALEAVEDLRMAAVKRGVMEAV